MQWNETQLSKCPLKSAEQLWGDWDILWEHVHVSLDYSDIGLAYFIAQKEGAFVVSSYCWNHESDVPETLRETKSSFMFSSPKGMMAWLMDVGPRELGSAISRRMLETIKSL